MTDLLLSHGYFLESDPAERKTMRPYPPLGLLYLSAWLKREGRTVSVFDGTFSEPDALMGALASIRPRFFGLYANLLTRPRVVELMSRARAAGARVIVGGPDASGNPAEYLQHGAHIVVRGEGECSLSELLSRWNEDDVPPSGVAGTSVMIGGSVHHAPDRPQIPSLAGLPWPDRAAIDLGPYLAAWRARHGYGSISLTTARGCPYTCRWCSRAVYGESHRRRPVEDVVDEIASIKERYAPERLWFVDDVFTIHRGWTLDFAAAVERRGLATPFECITRAERVDEAVADALVRLGCFRVWIGSESGSQKVLDSMERRVTVDRIVRSTRLLRSRGIAVGFFIMVGYEGENDEDLQATVSHIRMSRPDVVMTTTAYPIRGTEYGQEVAPRAFNPKPWAAASDRETQIRGRRSQAYYDAARRWIECDAEASRLRHDGRAFSALRPALLAGIARLRMRVRERERVAP